jgi:hypothetical protein
MGELRMMPKGKVERRDRLKRLAIKFGLVDSAAKAMRTSEITLWLRRNAPRGEPLEQIARRLIKGI